MNFEKVPYTTREGAIDWLLAHLDELEDVCENEFTGAGYDEQDKIKRARAVEILESLRSETR